ncbi:Arc family DNA-binding protein [Sinorhizobium meliloti]|uniref:Arc family DNA-binding protein n=1 Tax=Rhizobium meliloti TaxID=382 RepID=UPI000FDC1ACE|nr:Arc family DNA-binding protein [Sinorhizobium meliloti]MDX0424485.1 Arc family DNA-binding protein [Sinorhizobium medicae]RVK56942.1 Arc family DNA-binding protein [Sinorhizobium meliloti]
MAIGRRNQDQYMLRLPDGLRDEIKAAAEANNRSMNSEIIARLSVGTETLRDRFAGQALAGLMAMPDGPNGNFHNNCQDIGGYAYAIADKLIAARKAGA